MQVCFITESYPPALCGIGDYTARLAHEVATAGYKVSVLTSSCYGIARTVSSPIVLPSIRSWSLFRSRQLVASVMSVNPDIVHIQLPNWKYSDHYLFNIQVPLIRMRLPRARIVVTFHEPLIVYRRHLRAVSRSYLRVLVSILPADMLIFVEERILRMAGSVWGLSRVRAKSTVIPVASNIPISRQSEEERKSLRQQLDVSGGTLLIGHFGFVHKAKGFEDILKVVKILRERGVPAVLLFVGRLDPNEPYQRELMAAVKSSGLEDHVKMTGNLTEASVADHLSACDACIFPFTCGVTPKATSFLASVSQGVFTVATHSERRGLCEAENTYYVAPGDGHEMAEAIVRFAGHRTPPGTGPWETWDRIAHQHLQCYADVTEMRPKRGSFLGNVRDF